ncbi:hypothetical protein [Marinobacter sp. SS21]|uniref:hypothetical protein n=1 Tax=Marinobacter sp. SS21 TaxID=2979460 RepID=UPI0023307C71|nr:hypothetical protein [Marinobacter sp. SS21]MDC0661489.1 hypothetical protein [Marinobacter sp. SS21]
MAVAIWQLTVIDPPPEPAPQSVEANRPDAPPPDSAPSWPAPQGQVAATSDPELELVIYLQERYGATIEHGHSQVKAIEKLAGYLRSRYPDDWEERLRGMLSLAFPDRVDELMAMHSRMTGYSAWLESERQNLQALSPEDRLQLLWEMRRSFFGDAAEEIWAETLRNQQVSDALTELGNLPPDSGFRDQTQHYLNALSSAYGAQTDTVMALRRQELADRFLSSDAVQARLHDMPAEQRREQLADFRRALGMDEDAVARWQALDAQRDRRRQIGMDYMSKRQQLQQQYSGAEFQSRLRNLQQNQFGAEAEIIRNEEQSGYYRFTEPQVYGLN